MIDGVSYDRVLEVSKRKVGARQVLPDRARSPSAPGRELVDDPRLRVDALFWHAARYGGVAPVEREVDPHSLLDDHVVLRGPALCRPQPPRAEALRDQGPSHPPAQGDSLRYPPSPVATYRLPTVL